MATENNNNTGRAGKTPLWWIPHAISSAPSKRPGKRKMNDSSFLRTPLQNS